MKEQTVETLMQVGAQEDFPEGPEAVDIYNDILMENEEPYVAILKEGVIKLERF